MEEKKNVSKLDFCSLKCREFSLICTAKDCSMLCTTGILLSYIALARNKSQELEEGEEEEEDDDEKKINNFLRLE